jgi:myo-inositol catabolism protein IolH
MLDRRTLMKCGAAAAGSVWSAAATVARADATARPTLSIETDMFRRLSRAEAFAAIRAAGYHYVELKARDRSGPYIPHTLPASDEVLRQLKRDLASAGLTPVAAFIVHLIADADETVRREAVARWRRSLDMVGRLGLKLITTELTGDRDRPKEGEAAFRRSMDEILPVAERAGIHISVEPHTADFFETAAPTLKLVRSYGSKSLGYLHVTPHSFILGPSMREVIRAAGPLLTHVHLADSLRPERFMVRGKPISPHLHATPGLGEVDFRETFDALAEIGYTGYVSSQLISHMDRPQEAATQTRVYLQKLLGDRLRV